MMSKVVKVEQGQCIEDIAIQEYGCIEGVFEIIEDNNLDLDSDLPVGKELIIKKEIPQLTSNNKEVARYFNEKRFFPNTGVMAELVNNDFVTPGYWEEGYTE